MAWMGSEQMSNTTLYLGDCLNILPTLEAGSIDAIVCDPPYGLSFMGKAWDHGVPGAPFWEAALRVAKPGAMLLAFGGTRTHHRLMCAIEDAGWGIRDCLMWLYGSGFPKGHSQLKPAWEPIIMARKPLIGTVADNVLAHGCGELNVDACRIGIDRDDDALRIRHNSRTIGGNGKYGGGAAVGTSSNPQGRWPANLVLSDDAAALLDEMSGERPTGKPTNGSKPGNLNAYGGGWNKRSLNGGGDTGGASRYFLRVAPDADAEPLRMGYYPKASRKDRDEGLEGMEPSGARPLGISNWQGQTNGSGETMGPSKPGKNGHPCVKSTQLMRWLVRLVTPPGGVVLDPFAGSGSTGKGAVLEGFDFVGIELDAEYLAIAAARIEHAASAKADTEAQAQLPLLEAI